MKLTDFIAAMEHIAPPGLAMDFDNVGLLLGTDRHEITRVLVALDCTPATAQEAVDWNADLLLTHHPLFLDGAKRILPGDPATAGAYILLRHGIAQYAAHTNLDAAPGGVNDCLADALGIFDAAPLPPENLGRIGMRGANIPETLGAFAAFVAERLGTAVRICGDPFSPVSRVALIGGAGGSDAEAAHAAGADTFVTGEIKHHQALSARFFGLNVIEAGHYETERVVLLPLIHHLQALTNDVQYRLTLSEAACLGRIE